MMVLAFSARPIAFHPELARALGGIYEALMFQQLAYWSDFAELPDGWIYKTGAEFRAETTMTRYQLDKARASLVKLKVIETDLRGVPATMHYRVKWERLYALLQGDDADDALDSGVVAQFAEGKQTSLATVSKVPADPQQASLVTVSNLACAPSANPNRNRDYAETTQRTGPNDPCDQTEPVLQHDAVHEASTPPTPIDQYRAMTPEERLAYFEDNQARLARMKGLR